jgi:serine/threonine-protein kinase RsbW
VPGERQSGRGVAPDGERTLGLPHDRVAVPLGRRAVVADLTSRGLPDDVVDEAERVVAELIGNAVKHAWALADGTVRLHWSVHDDVVELEVTDGGALSRPVPKRPPALAGSGRGLRIVRSLAHEWGVLDVAPHRPGQTVWASVGGPSRRRAG